MTSEEIQRMHYDTLDQALVNVPGVQFQNYMGGMVNANIASPIRINGSKSVLILVDGVRLNPVGVESGAINANFLNNLDNVERIEVLKGSAGVLYGSDAAGGVINIITKKGGESKTTIKATTGSFGKESYHFSNRGSYQNVDWNIYMDRDMQGDFKDGHGNEWENRIHTNTGGMNVAWKFGDAHTISVKYDQSNARYFAEDPYDYRIYQNEYQKTKGRLRMQNTNLTHEWQFDENTSNRLTYTVERYANEYYENQVNGLWGANMGNAYKTRVFSDQFLKVFDEKHTMIMGFDFTKTVIAKKESGYDENWDNIYWFDFNTGDSIKNDSYFIQDSWTFDKKWNMTAGLRYDKAESKISDTQEKTTVGHNLSKSLSVGYKFDDSNNIYISYADYFILPTSYQLTDGTYGNRNLTPAKGKNYSIGYNKKLDDKTDLSVHAFLRDADKDILLAKTGEKTEWGFDVWKYANVSGDMKDKGFDVQLNKRFDKHWSAFMGYSYLHHKSSADPDNDLVQYGYLPKHAVNLGINYTNNKLDLGLTGRGFLARDGITPDGWWPNNHYWVVNFGANYQVTKNIKAFAAVNNLFNQFYVESSMQNPKNQQPDASYAMPGRNFVLGMELSF